MSLGLMIKTPDDMLDYDIGFSRWLAPEDRLTGIDTAIEEATDGSTIAIDTSEYADTSVKVWLSSGQAGDATFVSIVATTNMRRTKEACFRKRLLWSALKTALKGTHTTKAA